MLKRTYAALMIVTSLLFGTVPVHQAAQAPTTADALATAQTATSLSREEAEAIAREALTLAPERGEVIEIERDREKGRAVREVTLRDGAVEYDVEIDEGTGEVLKIEQERSRPDAEGKDGGAKPVKTSPAETEASLSEEQAIAAVLRDIGISADQATSIRVERDREDGAAVYEIKLRPETAKYDYTLHGQTGQILERETEHLRTNGADASKAAKSEPTEILPEQALELALAHASLARDEITHAQIERDREDGRAVFEVEFRLGQVEYEYELCAESGQILSFDREIDRD